MVGIPFRLGFTCQNTRAIAPQDYIRRFYVNIGDRVFLKRSKHDLERVTVRPHGLNYVPQIIIDKEAPPRRVRVVYRMGFCVAVLV